LLVGVLAVLLLIPLAVTSFDYFKRKMGRNWKRLHWLMYPAAIVSMLHYALAQKGNLLTLQGNILKPFLWGVLTVILLSLRLPSVRRWLSGLRRRLVAALPRKAVVKKIYPGKSSSGIDPLN
jgi:sulfoxide reductase heme-binding subunit YedZ